MNQNARNCAASRKQPTGRNARTDATGLKPPTRHRRMKQRASGCGNDQNRMCLVPGSKPRCTGGRRLCGTSNRVPAFTSTRPHLSKPNVRSTPFFAALAVCKRPAFARPGPAADRRATDERCLESPAPGNQRVCQAVFGNRRPPVARFVNQQAWQKHPGQTRLPVAYRDLKHPRPSDARTGRLPWNPGA